MKILDRYVDYFVRITGGEHLWSEFKRDSLKVFFLLVTVIGGVGIVIDSLVGRIYGLVVFFIIPLSLVIVGLGGLISQGVQRTVLISNPNLDKAKYSLYFFIYTGIFGCVVLLL